MLMTRTQIYELMVAAIDEDDVESAEVWQDFLDRMDEAGVDTWDTLGG